MTRRRPRLLSMVLAAAVVVAANVAAARSDKQIDLSANRRFTLSPESRGLARAVRSLTVLPRKPPRTATRWCG